MSLTRLALRLTSLSERYIPSAFVIACLLTALTFAVAWLAAGAGPLQCVQHWGDGLWTLLEFAMQMCLILLTGAILADSPIVDGWLERAAAAPRTPRAAVVWAAVGSMLLCWLHWGLGLVASAFFARKLARRHPDTDYRLLVAVSYFGMGAVWHAGLSGSAPLLVATPRHFLHATTGVIALSETTFSPFNLGLTAAVILALAALAWLMHPQRVEERFRLGPEALAKLVAAPPAPAPAAPTAWLDILENGRGVNLLLGSLGVAWLALDALKNGSGVTFNKLNLVFLSLGLLLHRSPAEFTRSAERAANLTYGIILQYPLYAGIYGVIKGAGLDVQIGRWFVSIASAKTYPLVVYWYSGVLNYFIPSGGAKWAVEAPYILEAAKTLGVPYSKAVLAYAWGDMVTDLIQPFFCLPLLAVARIDFKEILGYEALAFAVCAAIGSAAFLLL
ncbi:MAG: short-chain fatty acid transporter [Elusimicrobia bacterium]|nr:short-chain fatty acid transporter [Elusimicrobiota bacterium]